MSKLFLLITTLLISCKSDPFWDTPTWTIGQCVKMNMSEITLKIVGINEESGSRYALLYDPKVFTGWASNMTVYTVAVNYDYKVVTCPKIAKCDPKYMRQEVAEMLARDFNYVCDKNE